MTIPQIIELIDVRIGKTAILKLQETTKNNLIIYRNVKTGCKHCYHTRDFVHVKGDRLRIVKNEKKKEEWY